MESLNGRVVAITGGSEGIGGATAMRLGQEGARLSICARRADVLEGHAEAIRKATGAEVMTMVADASKADDMPRFIEETVKRYGRIDGLVNNGAIATGIGGKTFEEIAVISGDEHRWAEFRDLTLDVESVRIEDSFPPAIWRPDVASR